MLPRSTVLLAALALVTSAAHAAPFSLTPADKAEITALARVFFESVRDGTRDVQGVYPTAAELRAMFPATRPGLRVVAGPQLTEAFVQRQLAALDRDARDLRATFQGGVFVGLATRSYPRDVIDLRPCGRYARAGTQCGDGPLIEYTVGAQTRRFRLDTLTRLRGHWRVFDARP